MPAGLVLGSVISSSEQVDSVKIDIDKNEEAAREIRGRFLSLYTHFMSHVHPDIVVGEPIPEIEPRVNEAYLEQARRIIRVGRVAIVLMLVFIVFYWRLGVGVLVRVPTLVVIGALACVPMLSAQARANRKEIGPLSTDPWSIPYGVNAKYMVCMWMLMLLVQLFVDPSPEVRSVAGFLGIVLLMASPMILIVVSKARQPGQISCKGCEYPLVGLTLPCDCPECGETLTSGRSTTDRVRVRSRWSRWCGWIMLLLSLGSLYGSYWDSSVLFSGMPRSLTLKMAASDGGAFNRVMSGTMTEEEELALIEGMVEHRAQGGMVVAYEPGAWLGERVLAGRLSKAQLDRLYAPITQVKIDAPDTGLVGKEIAIRLTKELAILPGVHASPVYFFEGYRVSESASSGDLVSLELYGGKQQAQYLSFLMPLGNPTREGVPVYRWTPTASGEYTIRARVVFAIFAGAGPMMNQRIDWDQEGEAMFGVVPIWWREVELEHTVIVVP